MPCLLLQSDCLQAREASLWGVVLGTLGRQGNPRVFDHLCQALAAKQLQYVQVLAYLWVLLRCLVSRV